MGAIRGGEEQSTRLVEFRGPIRFASDITVKLVGSPDASTAWTIPFTHAPKSVVGASSLRYQISEWARRVSGKAKHEHTVRLIPFSLIGIDFSD
jgi:hypothetical protein